MTLRPAGFGAGMSHCAAIFFVDNSVLSFCAGVRSVAGFGVFSGLADVTLDVPFAF